jgi:hypothetical protein
MEMPFDNWKKRAKSQTRGWIGDIEGLRKGVKMAR